MTLLHHHWLDLLGLVWFIALWQLYTLEIRRGVRDGRSVSATMNLQRRRWMEQVIYRDSRVSDTAITANLSNSSTFFASTVLLITGSLFALLGKSDLAAGVISDIPFAERISEQVWEMKIGLIIGICAYAFFKFTWALRQFNYCAILIGAAPHQQCTEAEKSAWVEIASSLMILASDHYAQGLRAVYFAAAATGWIFHPIVLMISTTIIVFVIYRREFRSSTLQALQSPNLD